MNQYCLYCDTPLDNVRSATDWYECRHCELLVLLRGLEYGNVGYKPSFLESYRTTPIGTLLILNGTET